MFGKRLREARVQAGMSQGDLTRRSGVPKTMLSRYENDHILPSIATLAKLSAALNQSSSALLGEGNEVGDRFVDSLFARGITIRDSHAATQLAGVVADMVYGGDKLVAFLLPAAP